MYHDLSRNHSDSSSSQQLPLTLYRLCYFNTSSKIPERLVSRSTRISCHYQYASAASMPVNVQPSESDASGMHERTPLERTLSRYTVFLSSCPGKPVFTSAGNGMAGRTFANNQKADPCREQGCAVPFHVVNISTMIEITSLWLTPDMHLPECRR